MHDKSPGLKSLAERARSESLIPKRKKRCFYLYKSETKAKSLPVHFHEFVDDDGVVLSSLCNGVADLEGAPALVAF